MAVPRRRRSKEPELREVEQWAGGLSDQFLECRGNRHPRRELFHWGYDPKAKCFFIVIHCMGCGSEWEQLIGLDGQRLHTRPKYNKDYPRTGQGHLPAGSMDVIRLETMYRLIGMESPNPDHRTPPPKQPAPKKRGKGEQ